MDEYYNILIGTPEKIELKLAMAAEIINKAASKYQGYNTVDVRILKLAGITNLVSICHFDALYDLNNLSFKSSV